MKDNKIFIKKFIKVSERILKKISVNDINKIINILYAGWKNGSTVFVMGNGGSASTASHFAADLAKYASMGTGYNKLKRFKVICLNDNVPAISAWTNDKGFEYVFIEQLRPWIKENDIVVAFSVHGGSSTKKKGNFSQNIPLAFEYAKSQGAKLIGFSGDKGGILKKVSDACIVIPTIDKSMVTPQVEGIHLLIHHLIIHNLSELILNNKE